MREPPKTIAGLAAELGLSVDDVCNRLVAEVRALRARLPGYGYPGEGRATRPGAWNADLYAYDEALVITARLLEIPGAPRPELFVGARRLTELERRRLEAGIAAMGIEL